MSVIKESGGASNFEVLLACLLLYCFVGATFGYISLGLVAFYNKEPDEPEGIFFPDQWRYIDVEQAIFPYISNTSDYFDSYSDYVVDSTNREYDYITFELETIQNNSAITILFDWDLYDEFFIYVDYIHLYFYNTTESIHTPIGQNLIFRQTYNSETGIHTRYYGFGGTLHLDAEDYLFYRMLLTRDYIQRINQIVIRVSYF